MRPDHIPSVVGPVISKTNSVLSGLKSLLLGSDASARKHDREQPNGEDNLGIARAKEQIASKINASSNRLAQLEVGNLVVYSFLLV